MLKDHLDTAATMTMVLCSLGLVGLMAWRNFVPPAPAVSNRPAEEKNWASYATGAKVVGPATASVTIVEFSDFQCPFCKIFSERLKRVMLKYPADVRLVYRNSPIEHLHPHARAAAIASECAAAQGRFGEYHDALFERVEMIGVTPWKEIAFNVGVPDTASFEQCRGSAVALAALREDSLAAVRLGVTGTPTILINRWRLSGAPSEVQLAALISKEMQRRR